MSSEPSAKHSPLDDCTEQEKEGISSVHNIRNVRLTICIQAGSRKKALQDPIVVYFPRWISSTKSVGVNEAIGSFSYLILAAIDWQYRAIL